MKPVVKYERRIDMGTTLITLGLCIVVYKKIDYINVKKTK